MFKKLLTWAYIRYVYLPGLEAVRGEDGREVFYTVARCDPNWMRVERALYEKRFNTVH